MTIQLEFSRDTLSILNDERYSHPMPIVQRRMEALWLKSHNLPHAQIAKPVGVCENTLRDYFKLYQEGGVENCSLSPSAAPAKKSGKTFA